MATQTNNNTCPGAITHNSIGIRGLVDLSFSTIASSCSVSRSFIW